MDSPLRVLMVSSEQYTSIVQSTNFRTFQANAMARAQMGGRTTRSSWVRWAFGTAF